MKKKEDLYGAVKFLKQFMTLSYKQQKDMIDKLERKYLKQKRCKI